MFGKGSFGILVEAPHPFLSWATPLFSADVARAPFAPPPLVPTVFATQTASTCWPLVKSFEGCAKCAQLDNFML